ncbi:MAG: hypothetical protein ACOH2H_25660 [Cypionkella sp.]
MGSHDRGFWDFFVIPAAAGMDSSRKLSATSPIRAAMIGTIVGVAHSLTLTMIAEQVGSSEVPEASGATGVDTVQGYLMHRQHISWNV